MQMIIIQICIRLFSISQFFIIFNPIQKENHLPKSAMKRGKRQVIQPQPQTQQQQQQTQQAPSHSPNNDSHHLSNYLLKSLHTQGLPQSQPKSVSNHNVSDQPFAQTRTGVDDAEQKKRKIELLKQKYLKKGKQYDSKPQSQILQTSSLPLQQQNTQNKLPLTSNSTLPSKKLNQHHTNINLLDSQTKNQIYSQVERQLPQQEGKNNINQDTKTQNARQMTSKAPTQQQVPKPPQRIQGRNAPPPPPIKKNSPFPGSAPKPKTDEVANILQPETEEVINTKTAPFLIEQQANKQPVETNNNNKVERQDNSSFAPPSFSTSQISKKEKNGRFNVPPPLNQNMKQILNKKFSSSKPAPKPYDEIGQKVIKVDSSNDQTMKQQPSLAITIQKSEVNKMALPVETKNIQFDDEYNGMYSSINNQNQIDKISLVEKVDPLKYVGQWLGSPELTLKQLFPQLKEAVEFYCLNKHLTLSITSNNPAFNPLIAEFVQAFLINNTTQYTEGQKKTAESICLNFFYSRPNQFSDIFLVLLVKIGQECLQKYGKAIEDKLEKYLTRMVLYKNLFLFQQIDSFVGFCLQRNLVRQRNFVQFLMLSEKTQLLGVINNTEIQDLKYKLGVLSLCKINLKNKQIIGLYLKLISTIQGELARNNLVQKMLNHLKELQIPENLYQYTKQLKLKLLKNYDKVSQQQKNQVSNIENSPFQPNLTEENKDSGLFGYFNLNKAIDKIKTSTEKALGAVQKPKKIQEQEKKDEIVYDPVRKRYIINGEIPEDDNQPHAVQSTEIKPKIPPPPPIGGVRKAPPSIHNKKTGPRIAVNRYA